MAPFRAPSRLLLDTQCLGPRGATIHQPTLHRLCAGSHGPPGAGVRFGMSLPVFDHCGVYVMRQLVPDCAAGFVSESDEFVGISLLVGAFARDCDGLRALA